jgi:SAM-dependent methyltransferase
VAASEASSADHRQTPPKELTVLREQWNLHARSYDLVYGETSARRLAQELGFLDFAFSSLARRLVRDVLDLTAGTGLQAVALAERGLCVTAADLSPRMLERCEARARERKVNLVGVVARAAELTNEVEAFDACVSCFAGLGHIASEERALEVFCRVHRALRPGGVFVFDLVNVLEDALCCPAAPIVREGEQAGVAFRTTLASRFDTWNGLLRFREETEIRAPGRRARRVAADFSYKLWRRDDVLRLLSKLPWAEARAFRGYEDRGASTADRVYRLVFACVR